MGSRMVRELRPAEPGRAAHSPTTPGASDIHVLPRLGELELRQLTPAVAAGFADELRRDEREATLVSVLAYAGLRPREALALTWENVGERTILVERALSLGELKETKTRSTRSVRLLAPLRSDLNTLQMRLGRPVDGDLVFPAPTRAVAGHRLAQPRLPAGGGASRARPDPALRPPPLVRLAADRRAADDHRSSPPGGPLTHDDARHLRPRTRRARGRRTPLRRRN